MPPRNKKEQGDSMNKVATVMATMLWVVWTSAHADPLDITITIPYVPSHDSLKTTNVESFEASTYKNKITVGDVLDTNSSVQSTRSGPRGQTVSTFTRGTNSNHTLFMINGSPITDHSTTNGLFDSGNDAVTYATSIELYKGSQSTLFGPNAVGGAVNINTGIAFEDSVELTLGSNNTVGKGVTYANTLADGNFSIKAYQETSDGYSIAEGGDLDGYEFTTFNWDSQHFTDNGELTTTAVVRESNADLDASSSADDTDYTVNGKFYFLQTTYNSDLFSFVIDRNVHDREYNNTGEQDTYDSATNHLLLSHTNNLSKIDYTIGTDVSQYSAKFTNEGSYNSSVDKSAENIAYFVNADLKVNDWILNTGARLDTNTLHDDVSTYRIGVGYELNKGITAIAGHNTGFKAPTLYEMYGADNYGYAGNPNLEEERSNTTEVGLLARYASEDYALDSKFIVFSTEIDNMITYGNSTYSNADGKSTMQGWELSNTQQMDETKLKVGITSVHSQDSNNNELLRRPDMSANIGVEQVVSNKLTLWYDWNYYGEHKDLNPTTYATVLREEQHTTDIGFKYSISEDATLFGTVNNVGDLAYQRPMGYTQPGREYSVSVKYLF
tara:strand:+ start:9662 stop:11494 length:1833 start_codon:yes stop_codon:yes gene_type:complete